MYFLFHLAWLRLVTMAIYVARVDHTKQLFSQNEKKAGINITVKINVHSSADLTSALWEM